MSAEHRQAGGDIGHDAARLVPGCAGAARRGRGLQRRRRARRGNAVSDEARDGEVALDAAALVEPSACRRSGPAPRRSRWRRAVAGTRRASRPSTRNLPKRGHVEQADRVAHRQVLVALVVEPVLPARSSDIRGSTPGAANQLARSQPATSPKHRAARLEMFVQRRAAHAARGRHLAVGKVVGVEQAERLGRAVAQIARGSFWNGCSAADVDIPEVEGRRAVVDPLRQRHAGAAARTRCRSS